MSLATFKSSSHHDGIDAVAERLRREPAYQAFMLLRIAFTVAPIAFGLDKFFNVLVDWEMYLAPWVNRLLPGTASDVMHLVGVVEIAAGIAVALKPRYGAYLVAAWLGGIIVNLLTYSGYYDIALRVFGLMLGALTLAPLSDWGACVRSSAGGVSHCRPEARPENVPRGEPHALGTGCQGPALGAAP